MTFFRNTPFAIFLLACAQLFPAAATAGVFQCMFQKFKAATGPKPVTTQKIAESWSPEERKAAAKLYKETKQEILDPSGTSLESLLAQALSGSDLHHQRFKGSLDTMVRQNVFQFDTPYRDSTTGRHTWWRDINISGERSKSPIAELYTKEQLTRGFVHRTIYWPKSEKETTFGDETNFRRFRVAVNSIFKNSGYKQVSAEVIGYNEKTGEYVPFLYIATDKGWVLSRTFQGMPTREACIKCHSSPANPGVFTPVPQRILKSREDLEKVGYDEEAIRGLLETMHH